MLGTVDRPVAVHQLFLWQYRQYRKAGDLHLWWIYFVFVYALTELMDRHVWAIFWETIKTVFGLYAIVQSGWFGAASQYPPVSYLLVGYFVVSWLATAYFVYRHYREDGWTSSQVA